MKYVFWGTDEFSVAVLGELEKAGFLPALIVTAPDRKKGRGMKLAPSPVALWAAKRNIEVLKPEKLDDAFYWNLEPKTWSLFVVASYGKIIPKRFLELPEHGALNVHPSLLPKFRGASPIQSQIIAGAETVGVTIMLMDEKMDHGPILAQREFSIFPEAGFAGGASNFQFSNEKLPTAGELEDFLAHEGGKLLAEVMPQWVRGEIAQQEQDREQATYTQKFTKEDARINLDDDAEKNIRKIKAFTPQPGAYFFAQKNGKDIRVKITSAKLESGALFIMSVIPEGKREMPYEDFARDETHTNM